LATLLLVFLSVSSAQDKPISRQALVIGNAGYEVGALSNPENDARLMARTLAGIGFDVTHVTNLSRKQIFTAVREFAESVDEDGLALVYYAGHGMQIEGENYLIPVDMVPTGESSVPQRAYALDSLLAHLGNAGSRVNVVVLDACRNNPFRPEQATKHRSFGDLGLAEVEVPEGTLIAYSTAPGQLAEDGTDRENSRYTQALATRLADPQQSFDQVLREVGVVVRRETFNDQQPWFESSLTASLFLANPRQTLAVNLPKQSSNGLIRIGEAPRSMEATGDQNERNWYDGMSSAEWYEYDWELSQRVNRMTRTDIPRLEYQAGQGNVVAMTTLGMLYRIGVDKTEQTMPVPHGRFGTASPSRFRSGADNQKAIEWFERAAAERFPIAMNALGEMIYRGSGVTRDVTRAARLFEKAAESGYQRPKLNLAQLDAESNKGVESYIEMMRSIAEEAKALNKQLMKELISDQ
jgi:hypothetical protein